MSVFELPQRLALAISERRLVLLVGPEVGIAAGLPSFAAFLQQYLADERAALKPDQLKQAETWLARSQDHCRVAKLFADRDRHAFFAALAAAYDPAPGRVLLKPPVWLPQLQRLGLVGCVTTGLDRLLFEQLPDWSHLGWTDEEFFQNPSGSWLLNLNGSVDRPGTLLLTLDQHKLFQAKGQTMRQWFSQVMAEHTVLAVGFATEELSALRATYAADAPAWYVLGPQDSVADSFEVLASDPAAWFQDQLGAANAEPQPQNLIPVADWQAIDAAFLDGFPPYDSASAQGFYRGEPVSWPLVKQQFTAPRAATREVLEALNPKAQQNKVVLLLGAGGDGKSTVLKQVGLGLLEHGYRVYEAQHDRVNPYGFINDQADRQRRKPEAGFKLALLVDDAEELPRIDALVNLVINQSFPVRLVLAARENEFTYHHRHERIRNHPFEVHLGRLQTHEATGLAGLLVRHGLDRRSQPGESPETSLAQAILRQTDSCLLATMLVATHGRGLKAILADVAKNIHGFDEGPRLIQAVGLVVAIEELARRRKGTTYCGYRLFRQVMNLTERTVPAFVDRLKGEVSLYPQGNKKVSTRHPVISAALYPVLFEEPGLLDLQELWRKVLRSAADLAQGDPKAPEVTLLSIVPLYHAETEQREEARALYRIASDLAPNDAPTWQSWGVQERRWKNLGTLDTPYSARWLFHKATSVDPKNLQAWQAWGILERDADNPGTIDTPYSARCLFHKATSLDPKNLQTWQAWGILERDAANLGSLDTAYSARWLFHKATSVDSKNVIVWQAWGILERDAGNLGSLDTPYSARWLFHKATSDPKHVQAWQAWGILERDADNLGSLDTPYSARWLFHKATSVDPKNVIVWQAWGILERDAGNLGSLDTAYSARWLFHKATSLDPKNVQAWQAWGEAEDRADNLGDSHTPYSARWLYQRALSLSPTNAHSWHAWALMEQRRNNASRAAELVADGLRHCPKDTLLQRLADQLRHRTSRPESPSQPGRLPNHADDARRTHADHSPQPTTDSVPAPATPAPPSAAPSNQAPAAPARSVFVCYCPKDASIRQQLDTALAPLRRRHPVTFWSPSQVKPGQDWRLTIQSALHNARFALLLVTPDFLANEQLHQDQLPYLYQAAEQGQLTLYWLHAVPAVWEKEPFAHYQALFPPDTALSLLPKPERQQALVTIAKSLESLFET